MPATIHFRACGGLGNQLFQYATARALAIRSSAALAVDRTWYDRLGTGVTPRTWELERYPLPLRDATPMEHRLGSTLSRRALRWLGPLAGMRAIVESDSAPLPPTRVSGDAYLTGYWQDERGFADIRDTLRRELVPVEPPGPEDAHVLGIIGRTESVSVHVRRGDYVTDPAAAARHGTCSPGYYERAMALVAERVASPTFFLFSDDPAWTAANLRIPWPHRHVSHNSPAAAVQDLRLMAACRHHCIANSSFSWWAAWLAESTGSLVIAPERWLASGGGERIVPARWERIGI